MFNKNNGKMYHVNAYYDDIDDFNYLHFPRNGPFFYDIYLINDVIMCSYIIHFSEINYLA